MGYLTRITGSRDQAEDLFQETFRLVHEKAHTLRGEDIRPWLFKIATRAAMNGLRRRKRLRTVSLGRPGDCRQSRHGEAAAAVAAGDGCEPSAQAMKAEQAQQVRRAIAKLPEKQRVTLVLAYYQQLTYRQVAEAMGCSLGTVKVQMYRALRKLARYLPDVAGDVE